MRAGRTAIALTASSNSIGVGILTIPSCNELPAAEMYNWLELREW